MKIIIVGASPIKSFYKKYYLNPSDYFIGLDAGSLEIINRGIMPDISIGDFDSTTQLDFIKENSFKTFIHPSKKDETDLELAIKLLDELKGSNNLSIDIYDATGGRLDHEFNAYALLAKYNEYKLKIIDEHNEVIYLKEEDTYIIKSEKCKYFSLFPKEESVVTIMNAEYPINNVILKTADTYTISNKPLKNGLEPIIKVISGGVYLFCYYDN